MISFDASTFVELLYDLPGIGEMGHVWQRIHMLGERSQDEGSGFC